MRMPGQIRSITLTRAGYISLFGHLYQMTGAAQMAEIVIPHKDLVLAAGSLVEPYGFAPMPGPGV